MRQTIPAILVARNDVVHHGDRLFQVIDAHLRPSSFAPQMVLFARTWPHEDERIQIVLDADGYIARAVM